MTSILVSRRSALKFAGLITLAAHDMRWVSSGFATSVVRGYGRDPNVLTRPVTWPRTLSTTQLAALEILCNIVLPAEPPHPSAGDLKVQEFLDEWISAPYPQMQADRQLILAGLSLIDVTMHEEYGIPLNEADLLQQSTVFDRMCSSKESAEFARRLIELVCAGYYTTREGHAAIGYVGNVPLTSFPSPAAEIVQRFEKAIAALMRTPARLRE